MKNLTFIFLTLLGVGCGQQGAQQEVESSNEVEVITPDLPDEKPSASTNDIEIEEEMPGFDDVSTEKPVYDAKYESLVPEFTINEDQLIRDWQVLEEGLEFLEAKGTILSNIGDAKIRVLKIDPAQFSFHLINAKEKKARFKTADAWAKSEQLLALVNAGMFRFDDYGTNTAYMKNYDFFNNPVVSKDNAFVAFNPVSDAYPAFQIIDKRCQNFDSLKNKYHTIIQGIRMLDCYQQIVWSKQKKFWSTVCVGETKSGEALFCFSRSPFSVHDFIANIKALVPDVTNLMYLEGGPEASFFINHTQKKVQMMGSYETGFNEDDRNKQYWQIPNIIGIRRR